MPPPETEFSMCFAQLAKIFFYFLPHRTCYIENNTNQWFWGDESRCVFFRSFSIPPLASFFSSAQVSPRSENCGCCAPQGRGWFSRAIDIAEEMLTLSGEGRLEISFGDAL